MTCSSPCMTEPIDVLRPSAAGLLSGARPQSRASAPPVGSARPGMASATAQTMIRRSIGRERFASIASGWRSTAGGRPPKCSRVAGTQHKQTCRCQERSKKRIDAAGVHRSRPATRWAFGSNCYWDLDPGICDLGFSRKVSADPGAVKLMSRSAVLPLTVY